MTRRLLMMFGTLAPVAAETATPNGQCPVCGKLAPRAIKGNALFVYRDGRYLPEPDRRPVLIRCSQCSNAFYQEPEESTR